MIVFYRYPPSNDKKYFRYKEGMSFHKDMSFDFNHYYPITTNRRPRYHYLLLPDTTLVPDALIVV